MNNETIFTGYVRTDGGRAAAGIPEKKDCTVRALAIVQGISYKSALDILASLGRKPCKGFQFHKVARRMGMTEHVQPSRRGRMRVKTAVKKYNKGRFVFRICRHVFTVIDGVTYDNVSLASLENCIVQNVWENILTPPAA